jgi:hypothetical protein
MLVYGLIPHIRRWNKHLVKRSQPGRDVHLECHPPYTTARATDVSVNETCVSPHQASYRYHTNTSVTRKILPTPWRVDSKAVLIFLFLEFFSY